MTDESAEVEWTTILGPGPLAVIQAKSSRWRERNVGVAEEDIRIDTIRAVGGDQQRVLVRTRTM